MTDATPAANGHTLDEQSSRIVRRGTPQTSGYGAAAGEQTLSAPGFGKASVRPQWPGAASPAGWFPTATGEAAPPVWRGREPARSDEEVPAGLAPAGIRYAHSRRPIADEVCAPPDIDPVPAHPVIAGGRAEWDHAQWDFVPRDGSLKIPVVGPTQAINGRAGGPGVPVPAGAVAGLLHSERQSGWQLAQRVWQDSGVEWEPAVDPQPTASTASAGEGYAGTDPGDAWSSAADKWPEIGPWPVQRDITWDDDGARATHRPSPRTQSLHSARSAGAPPLSAEYPAYAGGSPLSAPVGFAAREIGPAATSADLFRAWQGSVREAAAAGPSWPARRPRRPARPDATVRRRWAWQAAKLGVPAVVIVTVGAGALLMLTGHANEMLTGSANGGAASPGATAQGQLAAGVPSTLTGVTLPGYSGQQGTVAVGSLAAAGGSSVAVGSADGHPATWRRAHDATWPLVSANVLGAVTGRLTGLAHGPAGWLAIGSGTGTGTGEPFEPLAVTSFGAVNWASMPALMALAGRDAQFLGVAAGPGGYVVVGTVLSGTQAHPAAWWSADLRTWYPVSGGGLNTGRTASVTAVAAVGGGFVAVGTHGTSPAVWTSSDGQHWSQHDIAAPAGAAGATLTLLATSGTRVVAGGYARGRSGPFPVIASSADGGASWTQVVLATSGGLGTVTALLASGSGFTAAGLAGPAGAQQPVGWTSPDGLAWSAASPPRHAGGTITALTPAASATGNAGTGLTGAVQQGATATVRTVAIP
jgi:hypothetical protein